jgi:hypothetical protein
MRTTKRTNQFKKDYKRETKGRSSTYAQKLDSELAAVVQVLPEFDAFMAAIEAPAATVPEFVELFKRRMPWATSAD